jgi:hypothetical protein
VSTFKSTIRTWNFSFFVSGLNGLSGVLLHEVAASVIVLRIYPAYWLETEPSRKPKVSIAEREQGKLPTSLGTPPTAGDGDIY